MGSWSEPKPGPSRLAEVPLNYEQARAIVKILEEDGAVLTGLKDELLHELVKKPAAREKIRDLIKDMEFYEALHLTLKKWISENSQDATFENLVLKLRNCGFKRASDQIMGQRQQILNSGTSADNKKTANRGAQNVRFGNLDVVCNFTGRVDELKELHKIVLKSNDNVEPYVDSLAVLCSVSGQRGIGKTTLSKQYANQYCDFFNGNLIVLRSDSAKTVHNEFNQLATSKLKIDTSHISEDKSMLASIVYGCFRKSKSLFIFDNAQKIKDIRHFLPSNQAPDTQRPYLLITSRHTDLVPNPSNIFKLTVLSESDSVKPVQTSILDVSEENARRLANALGCLPSAIQQALADLKKPRHSTPDKVSQYLQLLEYNTEKVLQDETDETTLAIWNTTF